ncbi:MAG: hypothetical protein IJG33_09850 [Selenomonadaceae bacterium]|nr:hypothetical protein [Selenomonadaceae bacterium]
MKWIKKLATFLIIVIALFCIESAKNIAQKEIRKDALRYNDTLEKVAKNTPLPTNHMTGMNPVVNDENLYIEFYDDIISDNIESRHNSVLCDWVDKDYKNELKIAVIHFTKEQDDGTITFSDMTVSDCKNYLQQVKELFKNIPKGHKYENVKSGFIGEGYFKVNGNVVIWLSSKIESPNPSTAFYYLLHKNRKTYVLSYFTIDSTNNQPNDVILTSLNTVRIK